MNLAFFSIVSVSFMSSLGCLVIVRALGKSSLGLYWLKGRVGNSNNSCQDLKIL